MAKITYMPTAADADQATVDGFVFKAYEPIELDDGKKGDLIAKLKRNPWFTAGEPNADRKATWQKVRDAQKTAREHRKEAARIEREALS